MHNRIKDLREDLDLRQIDVAQATGVDQKTLSNYETGKTNPDSVTLIKLAAFFKVSIDYMLGYSDLPKYNSAEAYADIITECAGLSDENKEKALDYMRYLKSKQK